MTVLEAQLKPFTTQAKMCAQLRTIADHLLNHFEFWLMDLEGSNHNKVEEGYDRAAEDTVAYLCKQWKAKLNGDGACKAFVFVNHQWVVKLGQNAVEEARVYNDTKDPKFRRIVVPTVPLGNFGCVQMKVIMPTEYCVEKGYIWDDWWYSTKLVNRRDKMLDWNDDVHMENVGFIDDILYMLDFAGADLLGDTFRSNNEEYCTEPVTEPSLHT